MKPRYISYIFISGLLLLNCQPDLDLSPLGLPATSTFYKTAKDAESAVTAAYASLRTIYGDENIVTPTTVGSDDGVPFLTGNADRVALWKYNLVSTNTFVNNVWSQAYSGIQRSNVIIDRTPAIAMDETLKKRYISEAKFLRALHYFNLVRFFGGVPLVINETTSLEGVNVPRATVDEVYARIETDLTDAGETLPAGYSGVDLGRATSGAAKGLLAKVYLTRAGTDTGSPYWALAAARAKEVIDSGQYALWDNYADIYELNNRCGKESLFEILYITDQLGNGHTTHWAPRSAPIVPSNGFGTIRVTKSLWDGFAGHDKRRDATFLTSYVNPTTGQTINLSIDTSDPALAVSLWKLADLTASTSGGKSFPYLRYPDVLLIYAEALNESNNGPTPEAYAALNRVRSRAGLDPLTDLDKATFKDAVLQERRLEFCWEGNRWFDLVRTGRLVAAVKAENSFGRNAAILEHNILFPIPQRERDTNPSLTQNPGY